VVVRLPHAPPPLVARELGNRVGLTQLPLPFPAGGEGLHHLQKNKTPKPVDFNFFFFFGSVSVFSFSDLLHRRSFFGLHLLLLRFRWPAVGRRRRWIQVVALAAAIGG
jgi:hypothetical protein